ncbi:MAG: hypothetical protein H6712_06620 [Myxococcales bacterium]|nr:hypothetical protein [Myxococcales bacterium]MCB9713508.1 hypothetical protein [Myxococcales bacterium]
MQVTGSVAAILWGVTGVAMGLAQQRSGLAPGEVDCEYRVQLIRDRVVAMTQRSHRFRDGDPQDDVVLNLIRETQAACTADATSIEHLDLIEASLRAHLEGNARDLEIRQALGELP